MQLICLDDWVLYIERNPLVILFVVLAIWLFSLWNRSTGYPPIEPLPDFNWETAEPLCFRPFKPKYHLTMALSSLDPSALIPMDKTYKDRLALRANLLRQYPDVVIAINDPKDPCVLAAINELYTFVVGSYLPTRYPRMFRLIQISEKRTVLESLVTGQQAPLDWTDNAPNGRKQLEILGSLVDEDFLILLPESSASTPKQDEHADQGPDEQEPKYVLRAYTACFPSGFNPAEKIGLRLASIHDPVPGYKEKLERSMDRFFARVEVGKFVQRVNWSVTTRTDLFAAFGGVHGAEGENGVISEGELDVDSTVLRCERQTLHRLPHTKALVFAFHTYTYPIQSVKDEGLGEDLATAIDGLKEGNVPGIHWYKRAPVWGDAVKRFLRS
ncbi:hypothetical protein P170DRAFT_444739 [Aspergillus steynii IBT 23096]|uniref:HRQ family protein 2 n=1 Tax=Aspergillus steynii IBT 23096 TaxID=1392250 RepID=A0A2I2GIY6_9EURO|nr:uncharacterized protein P170DRAFT_444739 [Aspergillus steynii IBT 23096]PLB52842.1 hypothetical protein P170DRAFT_444739 [Aspergillus steynii IBT 23096]